jgi:PD-(D/E)XK endonuclease
MDHPKAKGDRTTLAVMNAFYELGVPFAVPFGENTRYDLIIDEGPRLARVQCKTGRFRNGCVLFKACSSYAHHPNHRVRKRDYRGEVDFFAVYCTEIATVYLIPIQPKNNQRSGVRLAAQYEIAQVAVRATARPGATAGAG